MALKTYKPTTPGRRNASLSNSELSNVKPERSLLVSLDKKVAVITQDVLQHVIMVAVINVNIVLSISNAIKTIFQQK